MSEKIIEYIEETNKLSKKKVNEIFKHLLEDSYYYVDNNDTKCKIVDIKILKYIHNYIEQLQQEKKELETKFLIERQTCLGCIYYKKAKNFDRLKEALKDHKDIKVVAHYEDYYIEVEDVLNYLENLENGDN